MLARMVSIDVMLMVVGELLTVTVIEVGTPSTVAVTLAVPTPIAVIRMVSWTRLGAATGEPLPVGRNATTPAFDVDQETVEPVMTPPASLRGVAVSLVVALSPARDAEPGVIATVAAR